MGELMALLVTSVLVNNVILTQFLGMCPFMGVSKKKKKRKAQQLVWVWPLSSLSLLLHWLHMHFII